MLIQIEERCKPFSHLSGTMCLLPGAFLRFQVFPTLIRVHDLSAAEPKFLEEFPLPLEGPVADFTVQLDLEGGFIRVWGSALSGYFRYRICPADNAKRWALVAEKGLEGRAASTGKALPIERLSLGSHKAQDWELVCRRADMKEILPHWFLLGQKVLQKELSSPLQGTAALLKEDLDSLRNLFSAGFEGILSPRLIDEGHHGFSLPALSDHSMSPLVLLHEGARLIRRFFIDSKENEIHLLPALPAEFHCGRMTDVVCKGIGTLDFEWTKKKLRRMILRSEFSGELTLVLQKKIKSFRLRRSLQDRGVVVKAPYCINVEPGKAYLLDHFEK